MFKSWLLKIGIFLFLASCILYSCPIKASGVITNAPRLSQVLTNALNFLLSIFGIFGIIGLIIAGIIYLTASGNENRIQLAKKAFQYSIIGIVVVFGMMVIVRTIANFIG